MSCQDFFPKSTWPFKVVPISLCGSARVPAGLTDRRRRSDILYRAAVRNGRSVSHVCNQYPSPTPVAKHAPTWACHPAPSLLCLFVPSASEARPATVTKLWKPPQWHQGRHGEIPRVSVSGGGHWFRARGFAADAWVGLCEWHNRLVLRDELQCISRIYPAAFYLAR